jgi:hypothetical protein
MPYGFERLIRQARSQARGGEDPRRAKLLRAALGLWRGAAMQDVGLRDSAADGQQRGHVLATAVVHDVITDDKLVQRLSPWHRTIVGIPADDPVRDRSSLRKQRMPVRHPTISGRM